MSTAARILFTDSKVVERKIGDFLMKNQPGYLKVSEHVSHEISVRVPEDANGNAVPYPPGFYLIGAETFRTDDYGRLQISKRGIVLVPEPKGAGK